MFYSSAVYAADLTFDSPDEVKVGQEFEVSINYETNETYDVKVVVQSVGDKKTLSEIYSENKWASSYYFIAGAYPEIDKFNVRVKTYSESAEICTKIRRTSDHNGQKELCKPIKINQDSNDGGDGGNNNQTDNNNQSNSNGNDGNSGAGNSGSGDSGSSGNSSSSGASGSSGSNDDRTSDRSSKKSSGSGSSYTSLSNSISEDSKTSNKIVLGNDVPAKSEEHVFVTKEEKIRLGVVYSFAALCVLLIVLMSFNRL